MNKTLKSILLVIGFGLFIYGVFKVFAPEASLSIGSIDITAQDNTNSYIMIGLGLASILISFIGVKYLN